MRLDQFPDIRWLQQQSKSNFRDAKGVNNTRLPTSGWPNVVLNTRSYGAERNDIKGPFSLFLNISGNSLVKVNRKEVRLTDDNLCLTNQGDYYDLIIPEGDVTETFNIHFGEKLFNEVLSVETTPFESLLDTPFQKRDLNYGLHFRSIWKDEDVNCQINRLRYFYKNSSASQDQEYNLLAGLLSTMLRQHSKNSKNSVDLLALKKSTQTELMERISRSVDYIHTCYKESISLDKLASIACLSKYHYLRTFKMIYNCTPQQMIASLRFKKAKSALLNSNTSIVEIAPSLGFSEIASFTRFFTKHAGLSPKAFRQNN
ncbi:helix-turn-helix domain-containing protein [Roseivirga misakiensis]|uniref:HTH araC/xylS-type domain-containing protein n=1 Tax=Roseivirga misakiensis TaxID=1563681 RepID=A0A1E5T0D8_9BACT|nr:AraC family transcriptional regulator [Roseivirga misakiensis]OEK04831.1 hypothetical protein BFP71_15435 [Roseivirga misakiensis]